MSTPAFRSLTTESLGSWTIQALSQPADTQINDLLIGFLVAGLASDGTGRPSVASMPGFEVLTDVGFQSGQVAFSVLAGRALSAGAATHTLTLTEQTNAATFHMIAISGTPKPKRDQLGVPASGIASGSAIDTAGVTAAADSLLVGLFTNSTNTLGPFVTPASMTERVRNSTSFPTIVATEAVAAGATGNRSWATPTGNYAGMLLTVSPDLSSANPQMIL